MPGRPGSPTGGATEAILAELMADGCEGPTPPNLHERASARVERWFGLREPVVLPLDYPRTLSLRE